jgi:hypothetical protein
MVTINSGSMSKLRWYLPRSTIWTNKTEAKRIQKELERKKRYKKVRLAPRKTGYWLKVDVSGSPKRVR